MDQTCCKLTVFFEDPFWVGIYERWDAGTVSACKLTFGAEPRDGQICELLLTGFHKLSFSRPIAGEMKERRLNPKRAQRAAHKELASPVTGTKAQQAIALQREAGKLARRERSRREKDAESLRQFELRQKKRREKHKGH